MSSGPTPHRRPHLTRRGNLLGYISIPLTQTTEKPQAKAQTVVKTHVKAQKAQSEARQLDCEELIKDKVLLARAIARYLDKYWSVGTLRLTLDLLGPCIDKLGGPLDAYYRVVRPVLVTLSKAGRIELVEDQVVNLVRGGGNGSGQ